MKPTLFLFLAAFAFSPILHAKDKAGSKDHPMVQRFDGSSIIYYDQKSYEQLKLALSPIVFNYNDQKYEPYKRLDVEGRLTTIYYVLPEGVGTLEAIRNYENELKDKGFEILFQAAGEGIERNKGENLNEEIYGVTPSNTTQDRPEMTGLGQVDLSKSQYFAAKLARPEGDIYASALAIESSWRTAGAFKIPEKVSVVRLDICEVKPMKQRMVTVSADEMAGEITSMGKVALYGIYFDFSSADVKAESKPTLDEIAKLLGSNPKLKLLIVGHTDGIGSFESNRILSQKRAEAVVAALAAQYGIDPKRLFPVGVSFAAPVTSNSTEEGRAKNRRVELVEMYDKE